MGTITARKRKDGSTGYTAQILRKKGGVILHHETRGGLIWQLIDPVTTGLACQVDGGKTEELSELGANGTAHYIEPLFSAPFFGLIRLLIQFEREALSTVTRLRDYGTEELPDSALELLEKDTAAHCNLMSRPCRAEPPAIFWKP